MQQDQNIKGFTILELLVVIAIVAVISAVAYPNFSSWKKERDVRAAAEKVASMIKGIATQTERGNLAYSQFMVLPVPGGLPIFITKGMGSTNFKKIINEGNSPTCAVRPFGYWDDFGKGSRNISGITLRDYYEIFSPGDDVIGKSNISVHIASPSAICYGQGGSYYKAMDGFSRSKNRNVIIEGEATINYIIICDTKENGNMCPSNKLKKPAYLVKWSRFGNVSKFKWNGSDWNRQ